jgi:hypothetical protein
MTRGSSTFISEAAYLANFVDRKWLRKRTTPYISAHGPITESLNAIRIFESG